MMYHYTECGLPYIWLADGYKLEQSPHGEVLSIKEIDSLHRAIAHWIVETLPRLEGREVRFLRLEMGLKQAELAERLGITEQTVSLWERREGRPVPAIADRLLRLMTEAWLDDNQPLARAMDRIGGIAGRKPVLRQFFKRGRRNWKAAA